ncbi:MAG: hypothetical protein ACREO8_05795 [Luteimonas sp.]
MSTLAVCALLSAAPVAAAADAPCLVNYKAEGGFFAGRRFSTWGVVAGVAPADAYKRIYLEGTKSGLKVAQSEKDLGIISFEQVNAGVTNTGVHVNIPWNVTIEADGTGSKVSVTKTTPGGYATGEDFQQKSMCAIIDAARGQ